MSKHTQKLRIAYAGTPDFAVPALNTLLDSEHEVMAVLTQPDRKAGRGRKIAQSAVKTVSSSRNVQILQPENVNSREVLNDLHAMDLDIMVVAAYGQLFTMELLNLPKWGCINIHASLLPKWRGASPIQHAILAGDEISGVTVMQMSKAMDAGDIWQQRPCKIEETDTAQSLHDKLSILGGEIILDSMSEVVNENSHPIPQVGNDASYCSKLKKDNGLIQWDEAASLIERQVRAFHPWPGSYTFYKGRRIRIIKVSKPIEAKSFEKPGAILDSQGEGIQVATGSGTILISELVPEGGKRIKASDFANANPLENEFFG